MPRALTRRESAPRCRSSPRISSTTRGRYLRRAGRALAVELAPIRVNAVAPGVVRTDLWREMSEEDRSAMYDVLSEALPVGRVGEVGDIAETFLYLMANGYSSGTI